MKTRDALYPSAKGPEPENDGAPVTSRCFARYLNISKHFNGQDALSHAVDLHFEGYSTSLKPGARAEGFGTRSDPPRLPGEFPKSTKHPQKLSNIWTIHDNFEDFCIFPSSISRISRNIVHISLGNSKKMNKTSAKMIQHFDNFEDFCISPSSMSPIFQNMVDISVGNFQKCAKKPPRPE